MQNLSLDPYCLVLAGIAETQPALRAVWSATSLNFSQQKEFSGAALK